MATSERNYRRNNQTGNTAKILSVVFAIFMIIVYVGMGVLLCINFFEWRHDWDWCRWIVGVVLIIYGFYRGYRTYNTLMSASNTNSDE